MTERTTATAYKLVITLVLFFFSTDFAAGQIHSKSAKDSLQKRLEYVKKIMFSKPEEALRNAYVLADEATRLHQKQFQIQALNVVAGIQRLHGNYAQALSYSMDILHFYDSLGDRAFMAKTKSNIASLYYYLKDIKSAGSYQQSALLDARASHDSTVIGNCLVGAALVAEADDMAEAETYYKEALSIFKSLKDNNGLSLVYGNAAEMYLNKNNYKKAQEYLRLGLAIDRHDEKTWGQLSKTLLLVQLLLKQKKISEAHHTALLAVQLADSLRAPEEMAEAQNLLAEAQIKVGDLKAAIQSMKLSQRITDSMYNSSLLRKVAAIEIENTIRVKEHSNKQLVQINEQSERIKASQKIMITLMAGLLLVVAFFGMVQYQAGIKLKNLNHVKDKTLAVVSHDIRTPLNSSLGMIELLKYQYKNGDEQMIFKKMESTIKHSLLIIDNLLVWSKTQMQQPNVVCKALSVKKLASEMLTPLVSITEAANVAIENQVPSQLEAFSDSRFLEIILRNLVINAIQNSPVESTVFIDAREDENSIEISVANSGHDLPEEIINLVNKGETLSPQISNLSSGLGLLICKDFSSLINGKLHVQMNSSGGATFKLTLPKQQTT